MLGRLVPGTPREELLKKIIETWANLRGTVAMPNQPISLKDILEELVKKGGMPRLAGAADCSFKAWFRKEMADSWRGTEAYLKHFFAKSLHDKILQTAKLGGKTVPPLTVEDLEQFVRRVRMPPEQLLAAIVSGTPFPFERFRQGSVIKVFIAKRMAENAEGEAPLAQWQRAAHGSRDVLAVADLINVLGRNFQLKYELGLVPVSPTSGAHISASPKQDSPGTVLDSHIADSRTGAIVSLGSGPHNRISNEIGRRIFKDFEGDLPVQFRWAAKERREVDYLNETDELRELVPEQGAGIWCLSNNLAYFLRRDTDKAVCEHLKTGETKRVRFFDCGMLAVDVSGEIPLILAAGHGGNATRACIQALGRPNLIEELAQRSSMKGRFVGCLVVARKKATDDLIDDLKLDDKDSRRSWYVFGTDSEPEGLSFPEVRPIKI